MKSRFKSRIAILLTVVALACLFPISALAQSGDVQSEYTGSIQISTEKLEMAFVDSNLYGSFNDDGQFSELAKKYPANEILHLRTISAEGISKLSIDAQCIGVVVEPSETGKIELDLVGVKNPDSIKVETAIKDGQLTLTASANSSIGYICADAENRVNTVLLRVPAQKYSLIECKADTAVVTISDLGATINAVCSRGILAVIDDKIQSDCTLSTINGSVLVKGTQISGVLKVEAKNGSVSVKADTLGNAELTTKNGSINVDVGTISGDVTAKTKNGRVHVDLRNNPKNLALDAVCNANGRRILPAGWNNNERIGSGKPILKMSCENGIVELHTEQCKDVDN